MTLEYKQSLTELSTILNFMNKEYTNKLPNKLIKFIKENMDNSYICNINVNTPINEQPLMNNTKILLSLIYRNYWCDREKKEKLFEEDACLKHKQKQETIEKYDYDNLFKNKQKEIVNTEEKNPTVSMVEYKESIFKRILNKIRNILKFKK